MYVYDRVALKTAAKKDLAPHYWKTVLITLIYYVILTSLSNIGAIKMILNDATYMMYSNVSSIISAVLLGPMSFGMCMVFTNILRKIDFSVSTMFDGFKRFGSTFLLGLLQTIFTTLWSLLFVVPGIIKGISYSMAFYIQRDNPDMTANECLQASMRLTKGHKMDIFVLQLSFIGWWLLVALTAGLGSVFLFPYVSMSMARKYDYLILNYNEANNTQNTITYDDNMITSNETQEEYKDPFETENENKEI